MWWWILAYTVPGIVLAGACKLHDRPDAIIVSALLWPIVVLLTVGEMISDWIESNT